MEEYYGLNDDLSVPSLFPYEDTSSEDSTYDPDEDESHSSSDEEDSVQEEESRMRRISEEMDRIKLWQEQEFKRLKSIQAKMPDYPRMPVELQLYEEADWAMTDERRAHMKEQARW